MSDVPQTDRDMIARWEWFRRVTWAQDLRSEVIADGIVPAFAQIAKDSGAQVSLEMGCFLGKRTLVLQDMGLPILGADTSPVAVEHARALALSRNTEVTFFVATPSNLAETVPHPFDAILARTLTQEPDWQQLRASFAGLYENLTPGGCLVFIGAPEGCQADALQQAQESHYRELPKEDVLWTHREGKTLCARIVQSHLSKDFVDEHIIYVIDEGGTPRLESTDKRIPAYWGWSQLQELCNLAGFDHLETRQFDNLGPGGSPVQLNIAWKGGGRTQADTNTLGVYEE